MMAVALSRISRSADAIGPCGSSTPCARHGATRQTATRATRATKISEREGRVRCLARGGFALIPDLGGALIDSDTATDSTAFPRSLPFATSPGAHLCAIADRRRTVEHQQWPLILLAGNGEARHA